MLGYVLLRRGLRIGDLGLRWSFKALGSGFRLWIVFIIANVIGPVFLTKLYFQIFATIAPTRSSRDVFGHVPRMAIPFTLLNPFFEEQIVRAYLMTEVLELTGSGLLAVVGSTALQFSHHLYYGRVGAATICTGFLIFYLYYLRTRQATPIVAAHGMLDILTTARLMLH